MVTAGCREQDQEQDCTSKNRNRVLDSIVGQRLVRHKQCVLGTASTAFPQCEGNTVPQVAVQSRGPGSTLREVTFLQLGSLPIYICVWLHDICSQMQQTGCLLAYADKWQIILIILAILIRFYLYWYCPYYSYYGINVIITGSFFFRNIFPQGIQKLMLEKSQE